MAVFFALLAFFGWGVGDIFGTIASRKIGGAVVLFWVLIFSVLTVSLYIPFAGPIQDNWMFILAFFLGVFDVVGSLAYFIGFERGNASLVGTISASYSMITTLLAVLLFQEIIKPFQGIGIILTVLGVILVSFKKEEIKGRKLTKLFADKSILYSLVAALSWGIYFALVRIPVEKIGWFWANYPLNWLFIFFLFIGTFRKKAIDTVKDKSTLVMVFLFSLLINLGMFGFNLGITYGYSSVVAPISGSYAVLFVLLTRIFFKEPLTRQQTVGIVFSLLGIILISLSS